jgi:hypothetical protein
MQPVVSYQTTKEIWHKLILLPLASFTERQNNHVALQRVLESGSIYFEFETIGSNTSDTPVCSMMNVAAPITLTYFPARGTL